MADTGQQSDWRDLAKTQRVGDVRCRGTLPANHLDALVVELLAHPRKMIRADPEEWRTPDGVARAHRYLGQHAGAPGDRRDAQTAVIQRRHLLIEQVADVHRGFGARAVRKALLLRLLERRQRDRMDTDSVPCRGVRTWSWRQVWQRRLQQHWLAEPADLDGMLRVVADVCNIHAQVATSAEISLGLRVGGLTRADVRRALIEERSLVKTYGLRGTLHIFPTSELGLWLAALRAKEPPRGSNQYERDALPAARRDEALAALCDALDGRVLTRDELEKDLGERMGAWATEPVFPAFASRWPRWQLWLRHAAVEGLLVFGPPRGSRVTYARADLWLGQSVAAYDGEAALREVCRRYLQAYGPATHVEFARWFYTKAAAALALMRSIELEEVEVEGWRGFMPRDCSEPPSLSETVHLLPQYDCYVVGAHPREHLIPADAEFARKMGTAAPFNVVLVNGVVAGVWERKSRGKLIEVRVDTFTPLSKRQKELAAQQAVRIGEILQSPARVAFGPVDARPHL